MSLRFMGSMDSHGSGFISDAVLAFDQVTAPKQQGVNVRVTSNSWGGGGFSQSLKDAIRVRLPASCMSARRVTATRTPTPRRSTKIPEALHR
jgi:hypothetical protein